MARNERDREDLIAEATGLSPRGELSYAGHAVPIVAGFGKRGDLRVYLSADHMLQFDSEGRMRRGFWEGRLIRTHGDHVAVLTRVRSPERTELQRRAMTPDDVAAFVGRVARAITELLVELETGRATLHRVVGAAPEAFLGRLRRHLSACRARLQSSRWMGPAIPTKRR